MVVNMDDTSEYRALASDESKEDLPRISYDLRDHQLGIIISWSIIFVTGGILPIVLYFVLKYVAKLQLSTTLAVTSALFGVFSVFSLIKRSWLLLKKNSTCRPLGASRAAMDFFHINFIGAFVAITAVSVIGNITLNIRIVTLGLPILITEVSFQLLIAAILSQMRVKIPFRVSSVPAGRPAKSGVLVLAEDIIAVDAGEGQTYRKQLMARYNASRVVRQLCHELDYFWGIIGTIVGAGNIVAVFIVPNAELAYVLGWAVPWTFAAIMALLTIGICKARLRHEVYEKGTSSSSYQDMA